MYESGVGAPLLLIHSINAAASAAEVRPVYEQFASSRRVFAVDLPGFGLSERSDRDYSIQLMTAAVHDAVDFIRRECGPEPIDALAVSLSSEFLARAAVEKPDRFKSLSLVSPTGFRHAQTLRGPPGSARGQPWVYKLLRGPGWGKFLYRGLTRPQVIRYFLNRTWGSRHIDEPLWRYDVLTARQPGAEHAPLHFLGARLFSADIHTIYDRLDLPVWVSHGVRGDFTDYELLRLLKRESWRITVYTTGAMCYFECPERFNDDFESFLDTAGVTPNSPDTAP
jgi:pimeloyl-ACP methyl ester carboxylesterase